MSDTLTTFHNRSGGAAAPNMLFPGLPGYQGPTKGWFSLLHHADSLVEWSDNVMKRIEYINKHKPVAEREIRLAHIVYLGQRGADYKAKRAPLYADYEAKHTPLLADIIAYIKPLIDDFRWDGRELVFG